MKEIIISSTKRSGTGFNVSKNRYRDRFSQRHVVLAVVHAATFKQCSINAQIARDAGADGIFLINHEIGCDQLIKIFESICQKHSDWFVGMNLLGPSALEVFSQLPPNLDGLWVDNTLIDERSDKQPDADLVCDEKIKHEFTGLYFGGVAFKYQREVQNLGTAAKIASRHMDVVTTSGESTGSAASVEKIRIMKQALGDYPLAIASGITPYNVGKYLDVADCFLVATGISSSFRYLDPNLTKELVEKVRAYG